MKSKETREDKEGLKRDRTRDYGCEFLSMNPLCRLVGFACEVPNL